MTPQHPRIIPDRDQYRRFYLDEDITFTLTNGHVIQVCAGYRFNGHSVPFGLRWLFPNTLHHKDLPAALVHDILLETQGWHRYNRAFIDLQYKHFQRLYIHSKWRAHWMTKAVRAWGFVTTTLWGDYRGEPYCHTQLSICVKNNTI